MCLVHQASWSHGCGSSVLLCGWCGTFSDWEYIVKKHCFIGTFGFGTGNTAHKDHEGPNADGILVTHCHATSTGGSGICGHSAVHGGGAAGGKAAIIQ